jgi:hypothetical protein
MTMTRKELLARILEVEKDRKAFAESRTCIQERILELDGTPHGEFLHEWAGTQALMNVFIMVITRCEGLLEDMNRALDSLPEDRPELRLIKENEE